MTRVSERHLIQQVDDNLVFIDEWNGAEVVKPIAEAQIVLDKFRIQAETEETLSLSIVADDGDEVVVWFMPIDYFPGVEHALNYFIDNSGVRQARALDIPLEIGE